MCLGVPMQVKTIDGEVAVCEIDGVRREASLMLVEGVRVGDFLLIHAGFAIEKLDEADAEETLALFRRLLAEGAGAE
jgi:hydrogenase expression/formation protein HypC